jgi:signal recognition particle receptor subunit beta
MSLPPSQQVPTLLILAHKTDLIKSAPNATPDSLAITRVRTIMERELEKRASQSVSVGIEGLGAEGQSSDMGGLECTGSGPFRFENWEGGEVIILATSTLQERVVDEEKTEEEGLASLRQWLEEHL